ncbi:MAG: HNH endonuclease [Proteobacteria bacterium]|nr:HNH endonuclease [Pseudomonadota bacterium]
MSFPTAVKENALLASGRHCCICHRFCGTKIEVHHIKLESEGGTNNHDNAIPLCFNCHADMRSYDSKHPRGTKYSESELKGHRDNWYKKVAGAIGLARQEEVAATDKRVYETVGSLLPWSGSLHFIRYNNFAGFSFQLDRLNDLYRFYDECENPAFEFIDADLEGFKVALFSHIKQFLHLVAYETFPAGTAGVNSVPDEWEDTQPERFDRVVKQLHDSAGSICDTYDALVKLATRKLGIIPKEMAQPSAAADRQ